MAFLKVWKKFTSYLVFKSCFLRFEKCWFWIFERKKFLEKLIFFEILGEWASEVGGKTNFLVTQTSKIPVYEKMWDVMKTSPSLFERTTESGVRRVRNSKGEWMGVDGG